MINYRQYLSREFIKSVLPSIWMPLILILVYLAFTFFLRDVLPSASEIVNSFGRLFEKYGYQIVFVGAFLEAALMINLFVPGASVVLVGAYFASTGLISYPIFLLVSSVGFFLGFLLDYLIGYYGWSDILDKFGLHDQLVKTQKRLKKAGGKAFFVGYVHPDLASFFAVAAGIVKMDIKEFVLYNWLAGSLWLIFWTGLVYIFGAALGHFLEDNGWVLLLVIPAVIIALKLLKRI